MKPSPEMVWLTAFTAAIRSNRSSTEAKYIADEALDGFERRFPEESKGNG